MFADLHRLSRSLRRSPASAVAAVLTLSLTLGLGAAIFAVVDAVLLTPPPFTHPDTLVTVGETPVREPTAAPRAITYATFAAWRERAARLATVEAFDATNLTLTGLGAAERVSATDVTPGFLTLLGVEPARGRSFDANDRGRPVAIVSDAFWRGTLAGDPGVVGRQIVLGGQAHTIVGVLPEPFFFALNACDIWRPLPVPTVQTAGSGAQVRVVARLAPSVSASSLRILLDDVSRHSSPPARVVATGISAAIAGDAPRMLGLLAGAAALAMLIAFANFAGLLVVRAIDRRRELAVRAALGARASEIARQLVLEAEALAAMGFAGGVLLALWITPVVGRMALEQFGDLANREIAVSWRAMGFVALTAAACSAACGSLSAFLVAQRGVLGVLRQGAMPPPRDLALRRMFVIAEVAMTFVLLVSVTLLGRNLLRVLDVNPGFRGDGVLTMRVSLPVSSYASDTRVASFDSTLQHALEERLGPSATALVDEIPLTGDRGRRIVTARPPGAGREAVVRVASAAYFDVMRIPIVAGRSFDERESSPNIDDPAVPPQVIVSESLAQRLFGFESPIGHPIWLAPEATPAEVVGVVGDVKQRALDEAPVPTVYLSIGQAPSRSSHVVVRSARPDADVIAAVREEVARLDSNLPVYAVRSMADVAAASPGIPAGRVLTATFLGFAVLALVLGGIGLFGVVAHDVSARRKELALRIALGADPWRILTTTLRQGAPMVGWGLLIGVTLTTWIVRTLGSVMPAENDVDVLSVTVAAVVLLVVCAGAVLPAARRAARTDPLIALRSE